MKKTLFKIISLVLVFAHLSAVCLKDVSFAEEPQQIPPVPEGIDFGQLGRIPDIIGHGPAPPASSGGGRLRPEQFRLEA